MYDLVMLTLSLILYIAILTLIPYLSDLSYSGIVIRSLTSRKVLRRRMGNTMIPLRWVYGLSSLTHKFICRIVCRNKHCKCN